MKKGCELKFGIVTTVDASKGVAKVWFDDVEIESDYLPYIVPRSAGDAENDPLEQDDHVVCLMDCNLDNGAILGCIYSTADVPPTESGANKWVKKFADGTLFSYDKQTHIYSVKNSTLEFILDRSQGFDVKKGSESLGALVQDLAQEVAAITVTVSGAPTPINNISQVGLIISRMATFFIP